MNENDMNLNLRLEQQAIIRDTELERTILITHVMGSQGGYLYSEFDNETGFKIYSVAKFDGIKSLCFTLRNNFGVDVHRMVTHTPATHWKTGLLRLDELLSDEVFEAILSHLKSYVVQRE